MAVGAAIAGVISWRINLQGLQQQAAGKRAALKKLALSGGIPPNRDVMRYFTSRQAVLEDRYRARLHEVGAPPSAEAAAAADPQLHFQEQMHETQRTLERLAAARGVPAPASLGLPKELPPSESVPRLLLQLSLIQELADLVFEQGVTGLASLKVEDPEPVADAQTEGPFLVRLPVRVRMTATLPHAVSVLGAIHRAHPLIDVRAIRFAASSAPESLDVEVLATRYLVASASPASALPVAEAASGKARVKKQTAIRPSKPAEAEEP
jgi:hypothetical protein